jgi:hypothetical protein
MSDDGAYLQPIAAGIRIKNNQKKAAQNTHTSNALKIVIS